MDSENVVKTERLLSQKNLFLIGKVVFVVAWLYVVFSIQSWWLTFLLLGGIGVIAGIYQLKKEDTGPDAEIFLIISALFGVFSFIVGAIVYWISYIVSVLVVTLLTGVNPTATIETSDFDKSPSLEIEPLTTIASNGSEIDIGFQSNGSGGFHIYSVPEDTAIYEEPGLYRVRIEFTNYYSYSKCTNPDSWIYTFFVRHECTDTASLDLVHRKVYVPEGTIVKSN